jgi:hypothetical protein
MVGKAKIALNNGKKKYYTIYKKRHNWADEFAHNHEIYIIEPLEFYFLDKEFFGHSERVQVL